MEFPDGGDCGELSTQKISILSSFSAPASLWNTSRVWTEEPLPQRPKLPQALEEGHSGFGRSGGGDVVYR